ncbi:MAG: porin [Colwellia sp.]|nr:porin [Colwellia sp.]
MKQLNIITASSYILCCSYLQANEVNIYGLGHLSADNVDDGLTSSVYVTSNSSRLGVNGEFTIDDNLNVIFQYESGVDLTGQGGNDGNGGAESSGQLFTKTRPSYIGFQGEFGKALIGHMPFLDQWANDYNLFADQIGDLGNLWEASGIPGRSDNVIYYKSPDYSGISITASYVPEEGVNDADYYLVKGSYTNDKLKLGLAYTNLGKTGLSNKEQTGYALTIGYYDDTYSVGGGFQQENEVNGISNNDRTSFTLGASLNIGKKGKLKFQVANSISNIEQSDATQFAIGYDYKLAQHTVIYVAYALMNNDDNVNFSINGKGHGDKVMPLSGNDPSALSIGVIYHFDYKVI